MSESINKRYKGFTLIEIIISMAIIVTIASSAAVIASSFRDKQNFNIAYDNLHTTLSQAKSYALSHVITECTADVGRLVGYEVYFEHNKKSYYIQEVCLLASGVEQFTQVGAETRLPEGIQLRNPVPPHGQIQVIRFKVLTGGSTADSSIEIKQDSRKKP